MVRLPAIQLAAPLAILGLLLSPQLRAEIIVKPAVSVRETYSDNPLLLSSESAEGQFISELRPSLALAFNGPRLKLIGHLDANLYTYSGDRPAGTNSSNVQLGTSGRANIIEDFFYVDGAASRARQSVSAFGPQFQQGYSDTNNDIITTYRLSPYLTHRFGAAANAQLRYTRDSVKSSRNFLSNSTSDAASLNVSSGPAFTSFGWDLDAYHQRLDDALAGKSDVDNAKGTLRYRLKQSLSLYTNAGYDRYTYQGLGGTNGGKSFAGGFTWTPSLRTSIDASIGRRYFGKTYSLAATVRSRKTVFNASYRDEITTARAQFLQPGSIDTATLLDASFASAFPDPIERRQAIDAYIRALGLPTSVANDTNYFSNRLLLQKQFQSSLVLNGSRSMAIVSVSSTKRTALSPAGVDANLNSTVVGALNDDTRQRSLNLAFNYRLSLRTSATLSAIRSRTLSVATGIEQSQTFFNFVVNRQFERKLSGTVELRRNQGDAYGAFGTGYRENAIAATLSYQL